MTCEEIRGADSHADLWIVLIFSYYARRNAQSTFTPRNGSSLFKGLSNECKRR